MAGQAPLQGYECTRPGCKLRADCTPVLVVPAHPLCTSKFTGCRAVLWLPLCNGHFNSTTVREFLSEGVIAGMKESIEQDFRANKSIADWKNAAIQMLGKNSKEFAHYEAIQRQVMQEGKPTILN